MTSKWREKYKVHPAADVFPLMTDEDLDTLGMDIKTNGLREPISFIGRELVDGRNRMEAMERIGAIRQHMQRVNLPAINAVSYIISKNIHRRHLHLTKQQQADLIVAAIKAGEKPRQDGEVVHPADEAMADAGAIGGRGKKNPVKARALEINKSLPKEAQVGKRTLERAIAKAEGKTPKPKPKAKKVDLAKLSEAELREFGKRVNDEYNFGLLCMRSECSDQWPTPKGFAKYVGKQNTIGWKSNDLRKAVRSIHGWLDAFIMELNIQEQAAALAQAKAESEGAPARRAANSEAGA